MAIVDSIWIVPQAGPGLLIAAIAIMTLGLIFGVDVYWLWKQR